jgi:hypothetical protein
MTNGSLDEPVIEVDENDMESEEIVADNGEKPDIQLISKPNFPALSAQEMNAGKYVQLALLDCRTVL